MINNLKRVVMATLSNLKRKVVGKKPPLPKAKQLDITSEESTFLLRTIANSTFEGKDVQLVYELALKLQKILTD